MEIPLDGFVVPIEKRYKGLCHGVRLDVYFPGFPTLKHLPHRVRSEDFFLVLVSRNSPVRYRVEITVNVSFYWLSLSVMHGLVAIFRRH